MSNCVEHLIFADLYSLKALKVEIISFLKKNLKAVLNCEPWKELKQNNVKLAYETLEAAQYL